MIFVAAAFLLIMIGLAAVLVAAGACALAHPHGFGLQRDVTGILPAVLLIAVGLGTFVLSIERLIPLVLP